MLPNSTLEPSKAIGFVEGSAANVQAFTGVASPAASAAANSLEGLPTYSQILSSDDGMIGKAMSLYQVSRIRLQHQFVRVQPWTEFFDRSCFATPEGTTDVVNRLNRNISHFYSNYVILSLLCSSYVLLINPVFSIGALFLVISYVAVRNRAVAMAEDDSSDGMIYIGSKGFTPMQLYFMLCIFGVVMFYLTSGSSVIFWLVITSLGVTCGHASMRRPPMEEHAAFQLA